MAALDEKGYLFAGVGNRVPLIGRLILILFVLAAAVGSLILIYEIVVSNVNIDWQSP
jgi:hypothetical protein